MRTSILIETNTRNVLRRIGRKEQTYDDIIRELIISKNSLDESEEKTRNLYHSS